jgi:hypothetical protein
MNTFQSIASIFAIVVSLITVTVTLYKFFTGKVNFKDKADPQTAQPRKTYWVPLFLAAGAIIVVVVVLLLVLPVGFFTASNTVDTTTNTVVDIDDTKSQDVPPPVSKEPSDDRNNRDGDNQKPAKK